MARVLLTGATGLIGRATIPALTEAGHEVVTLGRNPASDIACNLLDPDATTKALEAARASHLVHLAWHDGPRDRWISAANLDWMAATLHLVREFARTDGQRAVCAGSCAEYDWSVPDLTETSPLRPRTLYGAAKAGTGLALCAGQKALGLSLAWARIFFVYGPGEPQGRLCGDLISNLKTGRPVDCTDGRQERDFLHVSDLARALVRLLEADATGAVNVASGTVIPVRELIEEVAKQMHHPDLVRLGAITRAADDPARLAADVGRLRHEAGFVPQHDITSGVADILRSEGGQT
ncbi:MULTISPECIES: NAD(P)-dependent oxidoreductase [unclassified Ruegeria]|uniref:NAD-dependent epimerase/dehydratase family protein n=1 Tax=unclassified Ruegeria TaxID=2625375 RepID=UPI001490DECF|nr:MULTISPECIES: NAD(P)-dependent oxidoreductase [unclassified Ruegeria]NOD49793.1 NAD-dependent epimerase/dehydratase family protein [Ruegeria sp. HKCCD5849]NOD54105.1 NAD-dependent epimerase/dehydratase family protein [Ruegeria sp. HKCCD5851]NOD70124.1 NAD-dependent epimerase/dehydratase family protein [Ruegeria sp. HKCCD7303]